MDEDLFRTVWFDFVRKNYDSLKLSTDTISSSDMLYKVRNILAGMGVEMTPKELEDLRDLIKYTIEEIDNG